MSDYEDRALAVGRRIQRLRKTKHFTLDDLAAFTAELGHRVHPDSLSRIENGKRKIYIPDLLAIAEALEVPPGFLLALDTDPKVIFQVSLREDGTVAVWQDKGRPGDVVADLLRMMASGFDDNPRRVG